MNANRKINQTVSTWHKTSSIRDATLSIISVSSLYICKLIESPHCQLSIQFGEFCFLLSAVLLDLFAVYLFRHLLLATTSFITLSFCRFQFSSEAIVTLNFSPYNLWYGICNWDWIPVYIFQSIRKKKIWKRNFSEGTRTQTRCCYLFEILSAWTPKTVKSSRAVVIRYNLETTTKHRFCVASKKCKKERNLSDNETMAIFIFRISTRHVCECRL